MLPAPLPASGPPRPRRWWLAGLAVAVLAFAVRLSFARVGGLDGYSGYDDGVYYSAAANLLYGAVPYRDFLLLHPPGSMILLAPFVWLGAHTTDATGVVLARLAVMASGGLTAFLLVRIGWRWGWVAGLTGGLTYAVMFAAAFGDRTFLLEPVGTVAMTAAFALVPRRGASRAWPVYAAGALLGLAASTKIWYALPLLVFALFQTRRDALRVAAAGGAVVVLVCGPFLAMAPHQFVRYVVLDQLARPTVRGDAESHLERLMSMLAGRQEPTGWWVLALVLLLACAALAATMPGARCAVTMLVTNTLLLVFGALFYTHYASLVTPLVALVAAAAVGRLVLLRPSVGSAVALVLGALVAGSSAPGVASGTTIRPVPRQQLQAAVESVPGCTTAQLPILLALTDQLTTDLRSGCVVLPDTTGWIYDPVVMDRPASVPFRKRGQSPRWQELELRYLQSGTTTIVRGRGHNLTRASLDALRAGGLVVRAREYRVYRTGAPGPMPDPGR